MKSFVIGLIFSLFINFGINLRAQARGKEFRQLRSSHFIINYQQEVDKSEVSEIKDIAEKFYRVITQEFHLIRDKLWLWENRAKIYIAKDRQSYLERFGCTSWSAACVNYNAKIIYTYPGHPRLTPIFVHELTHIIFREYARQSKFPLWLDEGMATYMEDKHGGGLYQKRLPFLKKAIEEDKYIKLSELNAVTFNSLRNKSEDYVRLFYLQSFSLVNFIIDRYGNYNFSNFITFLRRGEGVTGALSKAFYHFKDLDQLEARWKKFYQK